MKKRIFILIPIIIFTAALLFFFLKGSGRETLVWAQELTADEISKIELVVMPSNEEERYKVFAKEEYERLTGLINNSKGRYCANANPQELCGSSIILYITLKDGSRHTVGNNGNTYLIIDADSYKAGYSWLNSWQEKYQLGKGDEKIPEDFEW